MNILFFLTPKDEVEFLFEDYTIRQALEKMSYYKYSAIPVLNHEGKYVKSLSDGDLLWAIKDKDLNIKSVETLKVKDIKPLRTYHSITIDTDIKDVIHKSTSQNFIPVVDDNNTFIGIVRRREIISYCYKKIYKS